MQSRKIPLFTGLTYHVYEWGTQTPGDLTFVLLHGFADLGAMWADVAERLAPHGHVVAPDLRGHGDSDWIGPGGYYYFMDYVADVDDLIAQVARPRVVLVGHSMGGSVAAYYGGLRPQRLTALALLEGIGLPDMSALESPSRTSGWIEAWRTARGKGRLMASIDEAASRLRRHDDKLDEAQARRFAELGTRKVEGGYAWKQDPLHKTFGPTVFRLDVAIQYWQRVTCPVLIVDGAESRFHLSSDDRATRRALFKNHRHVVVDGAGHAIARHQPVRVADLLLELIA